MHEVRKFLIWFDGGTSSQIEAMYLCGEVEWPQITPYPASAIRRPDGDENNIICKNHFFIIRIFL